MKKILISAYACNPTHGSESANGWNWATGLANSGFEVHCITQEVSKSSIIKFDKPASLHFHYVRLPFGLDKIYHLSQATMYLHYILWQWMAYRKGKELLGQHSFVVAHHVTYGSIQMGSFLYKLPLPFIFGPSGGGQEAPDAFKEYFLTHWGTELKRRKVGGLLLKYNPASRNMLRKADVVLVSNPDTMNVALAAGAKDVHLHLDAALPESFFPPHFSPKEIEKGHLKLLWIGRFMPRKGLLLLLEVMAELKNHPTISLTIVGDGEMRKAVEDKIKLYGLEKTVTLVGKVPFEKVKGYYASHDAFFFTSLRDSCPAQLIEAMAYGLPIVTLNLHGQAIIVSDRTGFRCECPDPVAAVQNLASALLRLYHSPDLVTSMSREAHAFALKQTWKNKIENIVQLYYPKEAHAMPKEVH
jgi:glycosyltransferase involved in cell wall biosynthesis